MVTGEEHSNRGIRAYTPFGYGWGVAIRNSGRKNVRVSVLFMPSLPFSIRLTPSLFQYPQYWKRIVHRTIIDSIFDGNFFPGISCVQVFYGF